MKVTAKGQVTIPLELRQSAGITPGSEVEIVKKGDGLLIRKVADSGRGAAWVKSITGKGTLKMSTDEIMELTRGE